jgi:hypothetical protein
MIDDYLSYRRYLGERNAHRHYDNMVSGVSFYWTKNFINHQRGGEMRDYECLHITPIYKDGDTRKLQIKWRSTHGGSLKIFEYKLGTPHCPNYQDSKKNSEYGCPM